MKYTEGNWHTQDIPAHKRIGVYSDNDDFIGTVFYAENYDKTFEQAKEEAEANAKLIAAAPDLLEACTELINLLSFHGYNNSSEIYKAKQAINKAKGE